MITLAFLALLQTTPARGLVVVAPASFQPGLQAFLDARGKEMPVEFAAIEDLVRADPADGGDLRDPPERIKRALYSRWKSGSLGYALLVGDADTFPVRFMVLDRTTPAANNYAFYASDLYYADLAKTDGTFDDWNGMREGFHARYFGEVRGESNKHDPINFDSVSYAPEIAVGRWPVHSPEEAALVATKTLAHVAREKPRVLIVHADGWIDARANARAMLESLGSRGFEVEGQIYGDEASAPSPARTLASLQTRTDLALHLGHGSDQGWHLCLGNTERLALASAPPAVFLSIGCSTAHFVNEPPYQAYLDEAGIPHRGTNAGEQFTSPPPPPHWLQPGAFDSTGFGAELVRSPTGGALVYIGCDTGAQPCALSLLDAFQAALRTDAAPRVGDAWRLAQAQYVEREKLFALTPTDDWYPPSIFFQGMKFVFLGDPTLPL
ncbi:MAG TPA: C25 family cysteine peptidase [Planctomycetota bacterium]|nr:C25 family cysteine peptidase [Planctomycetota bacterium]